MTMPRRFHQEYPKATLSIRVVTSGDILTSVRRKAVSCGIGLVQSKLPGLN